MSTTYVVCRIRDHVAEYWGHVCWTQDVRFAKHYANVDETEMLDAPDYRYMPFNPDLNQDKVCLVAQDNPGVKECIRHGSTVENV